MTMTTDSLYSNSADTRCLLDSEGMSPGRGGGEARVFRSAAPNGGAVRS